MTALAVIGLALLTCFLLGQIPLAVGGYYNCDDYGLWAKIGAIKIALFPRKKSDKPKKSKKEKSEQEKNKEKKKESKKMTVPQILALIVDLIPVLTRALGRFRYKLQMEELLIQVVLPGEDDPAQSATLYGQINGTLSAIWPPLVALFHIQEGRAGVSVDFTASEMQLDSRCSLSIKLGQLLYIILALAGHSLMIFLRHRRQNKLREAGA